MRDVHRFILIVTGAAVISYFFGALIRSSKPQHSLSTRSALSIDAFEAEKENREAEDEVFHVLVGDTEPSIERLWELFNSLQTTSRAARRAVLLRLLEKDPQRTLDRLTSGVPGLSGADLETTALTWVRRNPEMLADAWSQKELFHISHFSEIAGAAIAAAVDVQIDNIARLAARGSKDEAALAGRFALNGLAQGAFTPHDVHGATAKLMEFLQSAELSGVQEIRSVQQGLTHRWGLVAEGDKPQLSNEVAQLPASTYRDLATATLIDHYLKSGTLTSLSSDQIQSLFNAIPGSDQNDALFARTLDKLVSEGGTDKAIEVFNAIYSNPATPWQRMLWNRLNAGR